MIERLKHDFDNTPPTLRKAATLQSRPHTVAHVSCMQACSCRELAAKHATAGAFLFFLKQLEGLAPSKEYPEMQRQLTQQFIHGYLDNDLLRILENHVPPSTVKDVPSFRLPPEVLMIK